MRNGDVHSVVELLAVQDSSILCLAHDAAAPGGGSPPTGRVKEIPAGSIALIEVSGFRNDGWWVGVLLFQVLPGIGLTAAAASVNADAGAAFAVSMIPAALTTLQYASTGVPTPTFEDLISSEDLLELRRHAWFGGKPTSAQKEELLRAHVQGETQ